ncbi:hypothetical protein Cgig2_003925 [Carnegiea gigantea]|uniref:Transmembrane protein n=1 Tax=Carnegiea gigantea TaxID=171969 RepID=A0A9Q1QFG1_9CARY|nr:hypothetical protein Cgig2_003925 [Carnegiea gigantea]
MAAAAASSSSSLSPLSSPHLRSPSTPKSKPFSSSYFPNSSSPPLISSSLTLSRPQSKHPPFHFKISPNPINQTLITPLKKPRNLIASAATVEDAAISTETAQEVVSATSGDDGVSNIISVLLFIAFIGLAILTIGVIYIAVTDILQKREKEKFEKEEAAANKKKNNAKKKVRARAGPRGFGQKIDKEEEEN